jgi:hypothetical protein
MCALFGKWTGRRLLFAAHPGRDRDPWKQIVSALVELLPHLKETIVGSPVKEF